MREKLEKLNSRPFKQRVGAPGAQRFPGRREPHPAAPWVPVFNILKQRGIRVVIANPKWVKAVKGNKDDTKDSKWIGDLFRIGLVKTAYPR